MKKHLFLFLFAIVANIGVSSAAITVRLDPQSCSSWSTVYLWAWDTNGNIFDTSWPGPVIPADEDGWYSYTFDESITSVSIIWNDGTNQTSNITNITESTCFALNSTSGTAIKVSVVDCPVAESLTYDHVLIGDLYYNLNPEGYVAEVTMQEWSNDNYSGLTAANIPASVTYNSKTYSVTSIGEWAFCFCSSLTSVTIPNSVTSIGTLAFYECSSLTSVAIPNSVTSIGDEAFCRCSSLTSVTIPNSVTSIGREAFSGCSGVTSVTIPNSVISIGESAFEDCSGLTSISVESGNTIYDSRDNCNAIIETASNTLIAGCQNTVIPSSVTSIGEDAFNGCSGLTSVTIPNSVTSIGYAAFWGCSSLTSVTIPNSVTIIGARAFCYCSSLTSVTIPNSVTNIGNDAFWDCNSLKNVVFGSSLKTIGRYGFSNCPIETITCYSQRPPTVEEHGFGNYDDMSGKYEPLPYSTIVYVPADYLTYYQTHDFWGLYDVRPIGESAGGETVSVTVNYKAKDGAALGNEPLTFHFPEVPEVEGFMFLGWQPVAEIINGSITIQAVYKATETSNTPASVSVPGTPAQKLIREGNVYILRDDKTYTIQGQEVR